MQRQDFPQALEFAFGKCNDFFFPYVLGTLLKTWGQTDLLTDQSWICPFWQLYWAECSLLHARGFMSEVSLTKTAHKGKKSKLKHSTDIKRTHKAFCCLLHALKIREKIKNNSWKASCLPAPVPILHKRGQARDWGGVRINPLEKMEDTAGR